MQTHKFSYLVHVLMILEKWTKVQYRPCKMHSTRLSKQPRSPFGLCTKVKESGSDRAVTLAVLYPSL